MDDATAIAVRHAPAPVRPALAALLALDAKLGAVVGSTSEPVIGQLRLAWWRDALARLDHAPAPAEPLLRDLQALVLPRGVAGAALAALADGWEEVAVAPVLDAVALTAFADRRGSRLFAMATVLLGGAHPGVADAGAGWALADAAARTARPATAATARDLAVPRLTAAFARPWPAACRPLGILALLAQFAMAGRPAPVRQLARLVRFRLTGR